MKNVVHLADCMEFMKGLPDNYYSLSIPDPPYGIQNFIVYGGESTKAIKQSTELRKWDIQPTSNYFSELFRISHNVILWGANYFTQYLPFSRGWIVWDKEQPEGINLSKHELAYTSFNVNPEIFRFRTANQRAKIHACQKPVALYKWLLQNYAKPGQTIFDSHVGSGSIRIACHDLGFDFEGCEIDADYWQAQEDRFNAHKAQGRLFEPEEIRQPEPIDLPLPL